MHKPTHKRKKSSAPAGALLKATLLSAAAATALMLLLSLLLYLEWLPESVIPVGNALIKVLSAGLAGFWIGRTVSENAWLFGGLAGILFTAVTTAVFSLLVGSFRPTWTLLSDVLLSFAVGAAAAALTAWRRAASNPPQKA